MKNILVLIDLEKEPEDIAASALKIAHQLHANVVLSQIHSKTSLIEELHYDDDYPPDEMHFSTLQALADFIKEDDNLNDGFDPVIECIDLIAEDPKSIKKFVVKNNIWIIIQSISHYFETGSDHLEKSITELVNSINCPHLFIPDHFALTRINKIAYYTDLRYCDIVRGYSSLMVYLS